MVRFSEGPNPFAQIQLSNGTASFTISTLGLGQHTITATYQSDTLFALSINDTTHTVQSATPSPTPTATATPIPTATASATATATATPTATATATATASATVTP